MSRAVSKLPAEPEPRKPWGRWLAGSLVLGLVATWYATAPEFPLLAPRPVPPRTFVANADNAMPYTGLGDVVVFPPGDRENWSRRLLNASFDSKPVPATMGEVVRLNRAALAQVRAASRRPKFRATGDYGGELLETQVEDFLELGRLTVVAFRIGGPGGRPDPDRLVDALGLARRAMWAPQEAASVSELGAAVAESAYDAERAERSRLFALPEADLARLLRGLNALDPLEIPLEALLGGHRDHALLPEGLETGEDRFEARWQWLVRPFLARLRDGAARVADARIAPVARRDFDAYHEVAKRYPSLAAQPVAYMMHPIDGLARSHGAAMPIADWAHRVLCAEARFDALRIGLAAELYRRRHGGYPITLQALVPTWLPAVPADPYGPTRPLGWDGWMLSSIGPDGDDQRHRRASRPGAWPPPFRRDGDFLLWPDVGFAAAGR